MFDNITKQPAWLIKLKINIPSFTRQDPCNPLHEEQHRHYVQSCCVVTVLLNIHKAVKALVPVRQCTAELTQSPLPVCRWGEPQRRSTKTDHRIPTSPWRHCSLVTTGSASLGLSCSRCLQQSINQMQTFQYKLAKNKQKFPASI